MSERDNTKVCTQCEKCNLERLHTDVRDSIIILKRIDKRTEEHTEKLEVANEKMEIIENVASSTALEITKNTSAIAENMRIAAETNKELISIVAGKKQVPLTIFILVLVIAALVQFIALVSIFNVHLKFGSAIVGGEVIPKIIMPIL